MPNCPCKAQYIKSMDFDLSNLSIAVFKLTKALTAAHLQ